MRQKKGCYSIKTRTIGTIMALRKFTIGMIAIFLLSTGLPIESAGKKYTVKYATLAPAGSVWAQYVKIMEKEIEKRSGGEIDFRSYFGGTAGDEKTMRRKLKAGLLDMATFTGITLGEIAPATRVLELPMFFNSYQGVDAAVNALYGDFDKEFAKKGFTLVAWGEGGFVYLLTKNPVNEVEKLQGLKTWAPPGDIIVKTFFKKYGVIPVYLGIESVLTGLQTGGLDAVYGPPMAAIALQWYNEINYITDLKITCATAATLFNSRKFNKLPEKHRKIVLDVMQEYSRKLVLQTRKDAKTAMKILQQNGIKTVKMEPAVIRSMQKRSDEVYKELTGVLYSKEILKKALSARNRF